MLESPIRPAMRSPLQQALDRIGSAPAVWTPATLFAASEQGVWYDPSDLSTLFQDSAGSVPVTATGQVVGLMLDKSGRGNHATQATTASKPTLEQDANGKYYLACDGVDDVMQVANIALTESFFTIGAVLSNSYAPSYQGLFNWTISGGDPSLATDCILQDYYGIVASGSCPRTIIQRNPAVTGLSNRITVATPLPKVQWCTKIGSSVRSGYVHAASTTLDSLEAPSAITANTGTLYLMSGYNGTKTNGRLYGFLYRASWDGAAELRQSVVDFFMGKSGATL